MKYDIFISYRRQGGQQYARTLQLMLEKKGYTVFLDYDELVDNPFQPQIEEAIRNSSVYIIILSAGALDQCYQEGNWVRREIEIALDAGIHFVPVNPDNTYTGMPETVPEHIRKAIAENQQSEVYFGQTLNASVDTLIKNRIAPYVKKRHKWRNTFLALAAIAILAIGGYLVYQQIQQHDITEAEGQVIFDGIQWSDDIKDKNIVLVIDTILQTLQQFDGGDFMMGAIPLPDGSYDESVEPDYEVPAHQVTVSPFYLNKFEVTVGQWNTIMKDNREGGYDMPIGNLSYQECELFCDMLNHYTWLEFRLPTEEEWEYAARGGNEPEGTKYAGSDTPTEVAWYESNSKGQCHSNNNLKAPTINDIFNLSGNLSEWCSNDFKPYNETIPIVNPNTKVIRGGNYDSAEYELTITHREPMVPSAKAPTVGFRLALSK
jgi:hypothetical protein